METEGNKYFQCLTTLQEIIWNLEEENVKESVDQVMKLYDVNFPDSFNLVIIHLIHASYISKMIGFKEYFDFLKDIETKEDEFNKNNQKIFELFTQFLIVSKSNESNYLLVKMIESNLIDPSRVKNKNLLYFAQYSPKDQILKAINKKTPFKEEFKKEVDNLSENDWEHQKQLVNEGINPDTIAKLIRNDEIEKLQELSSQTNFDYNQIIKPSLYERCSFINQENVTLIEYAAFFGAINCFKFLLLNGSKLTNTGKYAIAGGHLEIIHLCEQNHSTFENAYETAIEFHKNDIFNYIYENKFNEVNFVELGKKCITFNNYEIFSFLVKEGLKIDDSLIREASRNGNVFLTKYFLEGNQSPKDILVYASESENIEFVKHILENKEIDINAKNVYNVC